MSEECGQTSRALKKSSINVEEQGEGRFRTRRNGRTRRVLTYMEFRV